MTILKYVKEKGWQTEIDGPLKRYQTVDIGFVNSDGNDDETQFSVNGAGTTQGVKELTELFAQFCKENNFATNTVTSITIVAVADTYEELENEERRKHLS